MSPFFLINGLYLGVGFIIVVGLHNPKLLVLAQIGYVFSLIIYVCILYWFKQAERKIKNGN